MSNPPPHRQTTLATEARFLRWFRASGGTLDPRCRIQPISGMGRGMLALDDILAHTTIFTIPRHVLLNLNTSALDAAILATADDAVKQQWSSIQQMGWLPLILAMLWERRRAALSTPSSISSTTTNNNALADADVSMEDISRPSLPTDTLDQDDADDDEGIEDPSNPFTTTAPPPGTQQWGPYFDIMPTSFSTPMFWPTSDLEYLAGTSIVDKIARDQAETDYHAHLLPFVRSCPNVFGAEQDGELDKWYGLQWYHVMGSRILSRSFHVKSRKRGREGETVDMDQAAQDDDDDDDDEVGEVMDEEQEDQEQLEPGQESDNDDPSQAADDQTRDTHEGDDGDHDPSDPDSDSDDDSDDDDEEEEHERVTDISMTPMADMLNARFSSDNARLFYKSHLLCMRTTKAVAAGSQLFNTYADPPNSDLLRRYGHVDEPNGNDIVELASDLVVGAAIDLIVKRCRLDAATVEADLKERQQWACSTLGLEEVYILSYLFPPSGTPPHRPEPERPTAKQLKSAATGGGIEEELVALARILAMSRRTFEKAREKGKGPSARIESVEIHPSPSAASTAKGGKEVRIETAQVILDAISLRLGQLPGGSDTKSEEALLYPKPGSATETQVDENKRKALVVRLGEKRVLLDQKRTVEYVVERLKSESREREKEKEKGAAGKRKGGAADKDKGGKKRR